MNTVFIKDHPLKNETLTVMLKSQFRKKDYPVSAKYRSLIEQPNGEKKEALIYLNGLGIQVLDYSEYLEQCNNMKPGDRNDKLNAKRFDFTAEIIHVNEQMHNDREIGLSHHGLTLKGEDKATTDARIFWLNNPKCDINGESNGNDTIFEVTVIGTHNKKKMVDFKQELEISNYVNSITDLQMLADIFHYFTLDTKDKTADDMKIALLKGDVIVQPDGNQITIPPVLFMQKNADDFRRTFINDENQNRKLILGINKAKNYNIITMTSISGNRGWYYNQSFLGTEDTELQSYFNTHPTVFETILGKIQREEKSNSPIQQSSIIPNAAKVVNNERTELVQQLFELVHSKKVILPEEVLVSKLSIEELKNYISNKHTLVEKTDDSPKYFERKKEDEGKGEYRFRIMAILKRASEEGKVTLREGTNLNKLQISDIEAYLFSYETSIIKSSV